MTMAAPDLVVSPCADELNPRDWPADPNHAGPIFLFWRLKGWEGYASWRQSGELGLAFRRSIMRVDSSAMLSSSSLSMVT
jgi:hypothetical protein